MLNELPMADLDDQGQPAFRARDLAAALDAATKRLAAGTIDQRDAEQLALAALDRSGELEQYAAAGIGIPQDAGDAARLRAGVAGLVDRMKSRGIVPSLQTKSAEQIEAEQKAAEQRELVRRFHEDYVKRQAWWPSSLTDDVAQRDNAGRREGVTRTTDRDD